jgi:hypothetical protein
VSSKHEALEAAAREVRAAQRQDRDELVAARRLLRKADKARDPHGVDEARRLLGRLAALVEEGENVRDMAPAVAAGHDGVLVATDRRVVFLALRRTLSRPYGQITAVAVKGRRFRARLVVSTAETDLVIGGLAPGRAAAIADVIRDGREAGMSLTRPVSSNALRTRRGAR